MEGTVSEVTDMKMRLFKLEEANAVMKDDIATLKGLTQVHEKSIRSTKVKVVDLTARSMANNIIIYGLTKDEDGEITKSKVLEFFRDKMKMETLDEEIEVCTPNGPKNLQLNLDL